MNQTVKVVSFVALIQFGMIALVFITDKGSAKFSKAPIVSKESLDSFEVQEALNHFDDAN